MGLLLPLVLCALAAGCGATSPPQPTLRSLLLLSHGCNSSYVLDVADLVLQEINRDQKDGYVLSLNRVNDVREHRQAISRREIVMTCPDCPTPSNVSDTKVLETVTESLAKYNKGRTSKQYSLVKVTKASFQWVFGPACFVEYLIKESPCTTSQAGSCTLQPPDSEPVGICHGSLGERGPEKFVSVSCNFFKSQAPTPGGANSTAHQADPTKVEESQQENTASAKAVPKGSVQHLPELGDKPEGSPETDPVEAFPVQVDLTTNPQGELLDISFLFPDSMEKEVVVLPFPSKEQRSAECPGPARGSSLLVLPP
uniref:Fetuin B n=1 Tax=Catagonus wagneri TaxID=51154 RepID=A0A8C3X8X8_9CETA